MIVLVTIPPQTPTPMPVSLPSFSTLRSVLVTAELYVMV